LGGGDGEGRGREGVRWGGREVGRAWGGGAWEEESEVVRGV